MQIIAVDTETERGLPWSVQWCEESGKASMWMVGGKPLPIRELLLSPDTLVVMHNALFDLRVLHTLGIRPKHYTDTMIMAYLLGMDAIGLKTLAYRIADMDMQSYGEVVRPAAERKANEYLRKVAEREWVDPEPEVEIRPDGSQHVRFPQNIRKRVMAYFKKLEKGTAKQTPYEYWQNNVEEADREQVEAVLGGMEPGYLSDIPEADAIRYACRDADATLRIYEPLWQAVQERELEETLERDLGCVEMVVDMMQNGIGLDLPYLSELEIEFENKTAAALERVEQLAGHYVNPNSWKQVAGLMHEIGHPVNSTGSEELDALRGIPVVAAIQEYRQTQKLLGTYVSKMPRMVDAEERIHTDLGMTVTETGRLASSNPNLQNIPMRTEDGRRIRKGFVAREGCSLVSGDYSQIEMRLAAHESQDEYMLSIFRNDQDIHTMTASRAYGKPPEEIDPKKERYPMKRTGFGVLYGITGEGLYDVFMHEGVSGFGVGDCDKFIEEWFNTFPGVRRYQREVMAEARRTGMVRDMFGRVRYVPEVYSAHEWIREAGLRQAVNAPIQSGAQGVIKEAMRNLTPMYRLWQEAGFHVLPLLQIHDELLWEIEDGILGAIIPQFAQIMVEAVELSVPVKVDFEVGKNWLEQKEWKDG